jgi:hypothetical protein
MMRSQGQHSLAFFLSHNKAEKDWASSLADALSARGASVFLDERSISPGEDIVRAISVALEASRQLVFLMSPRSVESQWVELEWASTLYSDPGAASNRVVPVLLEDCEIPFLLRRLKYIDARKLTPAECAATLLDCSDDEEGGTNVSEAPRLQISTPLRFSCGQYLQRNADKTVDINLRRGRSCYIYGPRMSGKTSLLLRIASEAYLLGHEPVYLDCSWPRSLQDVVRIIASKIAARRSSRAESINDLVEIVECKARESQRQVLIVMDEMDCVRRLEDTDRLLNVLRMLSDMSLVTVIGAGLLPPWELPEDPNVSPFAATLDPVPIGVFSLDAVQRLCDYVSQEAPLFAAPELLRMTGGHAGLTIAAVASLQAGTTLDKLALARQDLCFGISSSVARSVQYLVDKSALFRLMCGMSVPERDRERLWLAGAILDPEKNPPEIAGELIRARLRELLREPKDEDV